MKKPFSLLITAGPTREFIDPVRFISNLSTGNMGYALAKVARKRKHKVVLVSGPVSLKKPAKAKIIDVVSADDMFKAVKKQLSGADCVVMAAAVSDFKPQIVAKHKLKKKKEPKLMLRENPDILSWVGKHKADKLIVGFCMETKHLEKRAKQKLREKNTDIIVANKIGKDNAAFGNSPTKVLLIDKKGTTKKIGSCNKDKIAEILLDKIEALWYK